MLDSELLLVEVLLELVELLLELELSELLLVLEELTLKLNDSELELSLELDTLIELLLVLDSFSVDVLEDTSTVEDEVLPLPPNSPERIEGIVIHTNKREMMKAPIVRALCSSMKVIAFFAFLTMLFIYE